MNESISQSRVADQAEEVMRRSGIRQNPYFEALRDGCLSIGDFRRSQEQLYFAVRHYAQPMAALISRIPEPAVRLEILRNLMTEHGEFKTDAFEHNTFRAFLRRLGSRDDHFLQEPEPGVCAFNAVLDAACGIAELETGVACLGAVEYAFAEKSASSARGIVKNRWLRAEDLAEYKMNARLDVRHARDIFAVLESDWMDPVKRRYIKAGLELGVHALDRLYRDLLPYSLRPAHRCAGERGAAFNQGVTVFPTGAWGRVQ